MMHEDKMGSAPFSAAAPGSASSVFPAKSEWLTATEAAEYLKVKPRSLLLWVREGKVPGFVLSGTKRRVWRFRREDLDNALLSRPVVTSETPAVLTERRGI
jgi:excisionase family DNA binding protein